MARYVSLIQTCVRRKIEFISILHINCCVRSAFAYCEPSFTLPYVTLPYVTLRLRDTIAHELLMS